ncbi:NAD(P)-dependent glycerol-3-phosphate dehydrogenase [Luteolibacter pohnpeiensis]|uniref:Glycerol-3-phosphate dehydrogenase [NAD(P)+] n=1 Tax=Luteolibacter pohnpeiensis TaxID=454153 RepID=A0A934S5B4_9BACT|nr:NAD(P)H-dependent glycerol-3-phosphate dehydrogenase [Luteolibacter pohnpeiensis]MBK1881041.1 NAD(P)-dependent glycerol-3-phosphate dehydrogenase [Luteolibacter pohnpeiensis]
MSDAPFSSAAIIGSGSFGTALALLLAPKLEQVLLIGRDADVAETINREHRNPRYLGDIPLPENILAGTENPAAIGHPLIVFAVPTSVTRAVAEELAKAGLPEHAILLSCAKGIERSTGERMSEILREIFPNNPIAALSGPNHAEELARGLASCAVIGSDDFDLAVRLQEAITLPHFRIYTSDDLAGMELGGAVKNVFAIAAGIAHGLGLGDNAVAALVTRALAEMTRLGTELGGRAETFNGLSGMGDLLVTCYSNHSRNHRVGFALGEGKSLDEAVSVLGMVAEGVPNTLSIYDAARKAHVRTPIIDAVHSILYGGKPAAQAMQELLTRDPRPEPE